MIAIHLAQEREMCRHLQKIKIMRDLMTIPRNEAQKLSILIVVISTVPLPE